MIPVTDLHLLPRLDAPGAHSEAARFARLEYGAPSAAWLASEVRAQVRPRVGFRARLAALVGRAVRKPSTGRSEVGPLRAGVAAVHFDGGEGRAHRGSAPAGHARAQAVTSASLMILPAFEPESDEELCECQS